MDFFIIALIIGILFSLFCIYSNIDIGSKILAILFFVFASLISFVIIHNYQGTSIFKESLPNKIIVCCYYADLEGKKMHLLLENEGTIKYIVTPYYKKMHQALNEGAKKSKGKKFGLELKDNKKGGEGEKGSKLNSRNNPSNSSSKRGGTISLESATFGTFQLPPSFVPKKGD